jgi:hypothetical protein
MGTKSRESIYGASVRHSAEQAAEARRVADHLACVAWSQRMLAFQGPTSPHPRPPVACRRSLPQGIDNLRREREKAFVAE